MSDSQWFVFKDGQSQGPFSLEALAARVGRDLSAADLVHHPSLPGWTAVKDVPDLAARLAPATAPAPPRPPAPPRAPAPAARPPVRVTPAAGRPPMGARAEEEPTLNPFRLLGRSFRWRGRFDRGQFAMVWFGVGLLNAVFLGLVVLALALVGRAAGRESLVAIGIVFWIVVIADAIVAVLVNIGALIRRLNDLGRPSWWVIGAFLPLVGLVLVIYLLVAQGDPQAELPASFKGAVLALVGLFGFVLLVSGILFAAIVLPSLLSARKRANEAAAIGDLRSMIAAQASYAHENGGLYESRWECLYKPQGCIPGYAGPEFLDPSYVSEGPKRGYLRRLHAGPLQSHAGSSPSSSASFAIVAWPAESGKTGMRSFCGQSDGLMCSTQTLPPEALVESAGGEVRCSAACMQTPM